MELVDFSEVRFFRGFQEPTQLEDFLQQAPDSPGFAFLGRSNVGKSTLINALFQQKIARTSKTPGRTQQINVFLTSLKQEQGEPLEFSLFDLPGYGHAHVSKELRRQWRTLMDCFFEFLPEQVCPIQIQDARHPDQKSDQACQRYLQELDRTSILVLNKIDKLKTQKERAQLKKKLSQLSPAYGHVPYLYLVSATDKTGLPQLSHKMREYLLQ